MRLKLYRLICKLLSKIYHKSKKRGLGAIESITEHWIGEFCKKHNDLIDVKRKKVKSKIAIQKYPYITIWEYTWDLDEEGRYCGKI